jgi:hypothetical protein
MPTPMRVRATSSIGRWMISVIALTHCSIEVGKRKELDHPICGLRGVRVSQGGPRDRAKMDIWQLGFAEPAAGSGCAHILFESLLCGPQARVSLQTVAVGTEASSIAQQSPPPTSRSRTARPKAKTATLNHQDKGPFWTLTQSDDGHVGSPTMQDWSRPSFPRPYICRFTSFSLLICPSA